MTNTKMITSDFSEYEVYHSNTAIKENIKNEPNEEQMFNASLLAHHVLQPLRDAVKRPIIVNSWFRSELLNTRLGGSKTSDHLTGRAADIKLYEGDNKVLFDWIKKNVLFDQLIWEEGDDNNPAWVHVSFRMGGNRNQTLRYKNGKYYTI
jgi:hypothetical protein